MDVKQDKIKQLIEFSIQDVVRLLISERKISILEGIRIVYQSELFPKLLDSETGLYLESPQYLYDILKDELKYGKLVQNEI
ncbi:MAG: hypothetical protein J6X55_15190 [Victivallales bacterium]|nr:hypothetical protein [Victivallales bacterium]